MNKRIHVIGIFLTLIILFSLLGTVAQAQEIDEYPMPARTASPRDFDKLAPDGTLQGSALACDAACLMDVNTGMVLFEKNSHERVYPASTTKIMTALLTLEHCSLSDEITVGSIGSLPSDATNIDLRKGEVMTVEEMLYGLMLRSGNDAAIALGQHISGSVEAFADLMNQRAAELGMVDTHYVNPHGLHVSEHYTSAHDMAILTRKAMENSTFRQIAGTYSYKMRATNKHSEQRTWKNTNKLINPSDSELYSYVYATGGKTGYTNPAKGCLVSWAKKDDMELIAVDLGDNQSKKWSTCITMFEYGFKFYQTVNMRDVLKDAREKTMITNAAPDDPSNGELELLVVPDHDAFMTVKASEVENLYNGYSALTMKMELTENLQAPIRANQEVGKAYYYNGTDLFLTCTLLASRDVPASSETEETDISNTESVSENGGANPSTEQIIKPEPNKKGKGLRVFIYICIVLVVLVMAVLIIRLVNLNRRARYSRKARNSFSYSNYYRNPRR